MLGIFVSLDLFLYYAYWELSLVPMALLDRHLRPHRKPPRWNQVLPLRLHPRPSFSSACSGSTPAPAPSDFPQLAQMAAAHDISSSPTALWLASLAFLVAFAVSVPVFPLHGWLSDAISEAPTAAVMVIAGKLGPLLHPALLLRHLPWPRLTASPADARSEPPGSCLRCPARPGPERPQETRRLRHPRPRQAVILGIFAFTVSGIDGGIYQTLNEGIGGCRSLHAPRPALRARYRTYDLREYGGLAAVSLDRHYVRPHRALRCRPADAQRLCRRVPGLLRSHAIRPSRTISAGRFSPPRASSSPLPYMLWMIQRIFYGDLSRRAESVAPASTSPPANIWLCGRSSRSSSFMGIASPVWMRAIDTAGARIAGDSQPFSGRHRKLRRLLAPQRSCPNLRGRHQHDHRILCDEREHGRCLPTSLLFCLRSSSPCTGVLIMLADPLFPPEQTRKPLGWLAILGTLRRRSRQLVPARLRNRSRLLRHHPGRCLLGLLPPPDLGHRPGHPAQLASTTSKATPPTLANTSPSSSSEP